MSAKLMGMVFDRYPEGGGEMILALKLADNAHQDGTHIFPSVATMAELTRQSRRTVQYQLKRMVESGWLIRVKEGRGGRGTAGFAAEYRISPAWIKGADIASLKDLSTGVRKKGAKAAPNPEKGASDDRKGCNSEQERVQSEAEKGATAIAPQPPLTPIEPSENLPSLPAEAARGARLPKDWVLTKKLALWTLQEQPTWDAEHVRKIADGFKDYWHAKAGKDARKTDWDATWRNWVRNQKPVAGGSAAESLTADWWLSDSGIGAQGKRVRIERRPNESTPDFLIRVAKASGRGPWIDHVLKREQGSARYQQVVDFFGDALLPPDFGL